MKHLRVLLLLSLASCATITASADQDISVISDPVGASCVLANSQQTVNVATTPGLANVKRMFEPLHVTCSLPGYADGEAVVEAKTRGRAWGNILLLGVPAVVDTTTGKGYEYDPDEVFVKLLPAALPPAAQ